MKLGEALEQRLKDSGLGGGEVVVLAWVGGEVEEAVDVARPLRERVRGGPVGMAGPLTAVGPFNQPEASNH